MLNIWKVVTGILALLTVIMFGVSFTPYWPSLNDGRVVPAYIDLLINSGGASAFLLWIWMLSNFFKSGPKRFRVLIGWLLFIFNIAAAPIYWLTYYVRQKNT